MICFSLYMLYSLRIYARFLVYAPFPELAYIEMIGIDRKNLVYSNLTPIDGEKGPVLFEYSKWYGEPNPKYLERIEQSIEN